MKSIGILDKKLTPNNEDLMSNINLILFTFNKF